jgi:hypothetical protein
MLISSVIIRGLFRVMQTSRKKTEVKDKNEKPFWLPPKNCKKWHFLKQAAYRIQIPNKFIYK